MSESELFEAFHLAMGTANSILFGYISLMSGFLVMSYLVASKLSRLHTFVVIGLFSVASAVFIFRIFLNRNDVREIASHMYELKRTGELEFAWFGSNPLWVVNLTTYLEIAVTVGGFLGCIVFYFSARRSDAGI